MWLVCDEAPTVLDCFAFCPFSFQQDGLTPPEVDVGRGEIIDALVIAPVIVLAYNLTRVMRIMGTKPLIAAMRA